MTRTTDAALLVGRILLGGFFVFSGSNHFLNTEMLADATASAGVPFATLAVLGTGALLLVGGLCIILGVFPLVGIACLALFLVGVTPMMHAFWTFSEPERMMQLGNFMRNVALLGAVLALTAIPRPWAYSLGAWGQRRAAGSTSGAH